MSQSIRSIGELEAEAARLVSTLSPQSDHATLITLSGELGAGKTAFTKAVAKALGVAEVVNSPTFVLEKIYELPQRSAFRRLIHIDAYRLEGGKELVPLGFDEILHNPDNVILLEWPEKVADALPTPTIAITLAVVNATERTLTYG